jgi:outer membrane immunogenic protein
MHKLFLRLAFLTAAFIPAASALAADLDVLPPPPPVEELRPATYDWTGGYAGLLVGAACEDGHFTSVASGAKFLNAGCGLKGGALAGYNLQIEDIVWGIEANLESAPHLTINDQAGGYFKHGLPMIGRFNGRIGYAMDDTLLFMTAGGAYAKGVLYDNYTTTNTKLTGNHWGWSVGAGLEHAVTDQFRVRFDYLYTQFQDAKYEKACCMIKGGPDNEHEVRMAAIWAF